jgi:hypothetical protein
MVRMKSPVALRARAKESQEARSDRIATAMNEVHLHVLFFPGLDFDTDEPMSLHLALPNIPMASADMGKTRTT